MPGETVKLQVELVEKNAEARLKALDKLAREMGNRKITLNFDEASLARWKAATDKMSAAQINAYAKIVTAVENTTQAEITAANKVQTAVVQAEAKKAAATERTAQVVAAAEAKKVAAEEAGSAKRTAAIEKTAAAQLNATARTVAATEQGSARRAQAEARVQAAHQRTIQVQTQGSARLIATAQNAHTRLIQIWENNDTRRQEIAARTEQTVINANARVQAAQQRTANATREHANAERELGTAAKETSGVFSGLIARFSAANLISSAISRVISLISQSVRQAVQEMKEMNKELTTIKMVTGASDSEISKLTRNAFTGAKETGRTVTDYLTASERFARAGYRSNIEELTQLSLVTQNVGGVTEDVASKFILAADAAWKLRGNTEALSAILDGMASVSDQNATDIGKLAEGMTVAGSSFANAGETAQTYTALMGTVTAATQRSGSEVARGLQTILFRVRQVKGEIEEGDTVDAADISKAAAALDSVGISVLNDAKELKSFSEIMGELNEKWDSLNSKQKAYLQNALAGMVQR